MARRRHGDIPLAEWIGGMIGALIVLGTIGYLAIETFRPDASDTILTATVVRVREQAGSFAVDVEVRNAGRAAAAGVDHAGRARSADGRDARADARLDYVPGRSTRHVTLMFPFNPGHAPEVHVVGYRRP